MAKGESRRSVSPPLEDGETESVRVRVSSTVPNLAPSPG